VGDLGDLQHPLVRLHRGLFLYLPAAVLGHHALLVGRSWLFKPREQINRLDKVLRCEKKYDDQPWQSGK
jgi:hypothetical protein